MCHTDSKIVDKVPRDGLSGVYTADSLGNIIRADNNSLEKAATSVTSSCMSARAAAKKWSYPSIRNMLQSGKFYKLISKPRISLTQRHYHLKRLITTSSTTIMRFGGIVASIEKSVGTMMVNGVE